MNGEKRKNLCKPSIHGGFPFHIMVFTNRPFRGGICICFHRGKLIDVFESNFPRLGLWKFGFKGFKILRKGKFSGERDLDLL